MYHDHPEFPDQWVVVVWNISPEMLTPAKATVFPTLKSARASIPADFVQTLPEPEDDPSILEVWI